MNPRSTFRLPAPDSTGVPWVLLGLIWLAGAFQQAGVLVFLSEQFGAGYWSSPDGRTFWFDLRSHLLPFTALGLLPALLYSPKWSAVACSVLFLATVGIAVSARSAVLVPSVFLISNVVPLLLYLLASVISLRRWRQRSHGI